MPSYSPRGAEPRSPTRRRRHRAASPGAGRRASRAPGTARCSRSSPDDPAVRRAGRQVELVGRRVGQVGVDGQAAGRRGVGRGGVEADDGDGAERRAVVGDRDLVAAEQLLVGAAVERGARAASPRWCCSRRRRGSPGWPRTRWCALSGSAKSRSGSPAWSTRRTTPSCSRAVTSAVSYSTRVSDLGAAGSETSTVTSSVDRPAAAPVGATLRRSRPRCRRRGGSRCCRRPWPGQVDDAEPLDLGAGHVVGDQVAVLDPEQRLAVGLDDVRLVDAGLLHVGAGLAVRGADRGRQRWA